MTRVSTVAAAPATIDAAGLFELDPDTADLLAEVEAVLCAALVPSRRPPAPPAIGCAVAEPRLADRSSAALVRPRRVPAQRVRAVQRSPPRRVTNEEENEMEGR